MVPAHHMAECFNYCFDAESRLEQLVEIPWSPCNNGKGQVRQSWVRTVDRIQQFNALNIVQALWAYVHQLNPIHAVRDWGHMHQIDMH